VAHKRGGDGSFVAAGRSIAPYIAGLDVRGVSGEHVAIPSAGGEAGLIVRSVLGGMRTAVHPDGHRRTGFPAPEHPGVDFAGERIVLAPDLEAERPGSDVPLGLEPADAFRHRDDGLRK